MLKIDISKTLTSAQGEMTLSVFAEIEPGARVAIYGESGAGKTSLLRILAGLMQPDNGKVYFEDECWLDTAVRKSMSLQKRSVGYVFQDYALFPNMTAPIHLIFNVPHSFLSTSHS